MDTKKLLATSSFLVAAAFLVIYGIAFASTTSTLLPSSEGNYLSWSVATSSPHYKNVDETVCNGTTDYNFTTTVGNRDSYGVPLSSVPNASKITAVEIKPCASRNTTGGANPVMNVFYRLDGVDSADAGAYSLTGTTPAELATTTFSSLSIIKGSTTTLEVGAVLTSSTKGARLSKIASMVTYTSLASPTTTAATTSARTAIDLTWTDSSTFEDGYSIERKTSLSGSFIAIATTSASAMSYSDSGLLGATGYTYRLRAFNTGGYATYGNTTSATTTTLVAPTGLTATAASSTEIDLLWSDNASVEDGYVIERKDVTASSSFTGIATTTASATSYADTTVMPGSTYAYRVRATDTGGYSAYSNEATSAATLPPPSNLVATTTARTTMDLTWLDGSTSETGFVIERKLTSGGTFVAIATTTAGVVSYTDTGLSGNTSYTYRIRAYDGVAYSSYSNSSSATTAVLSAPTTLVATTTGRTTLDISWLDISTVETGYAIDRKLTTGGVFATIASTTADTISFSDSGLSGGTSYTYRVRAFDDGGYSLFSNTSAATTTGLSAPSGLTATSTIATQIDLSWLDNSSIELGYAIERKNFTASTTFSGIATSSPDAISYADMGLTTGSIYVYRVRAYDSAGYSLYSGFATTTSK